ncbi:hypothetical protein TNIN_93331 [Trichonephila inaurata madagascariensis]|uniref:Uncharacterized protein n=1 Tax=Trichonephila inaurata madagascariensis TaxID=2747483 RepID=A0A8X6IIR0_9ARAC|nr:hypothetical protein TNIN_93331 [Trichonephila inaurata madagascariensis]
MHSDENPSTLWYQIIQIPNVMLRNDSQLNFYLMPKFSHAFCPTSDTSESLPFIIPDMIYRAAGMHSEENSSTLWHQILQILNVMLKNDSQPSFYLMPKFSHDFCPTSEMSKSLPV